MNPHNSKIEPLNFKNKANTRVPRPIPRLGDHVFVSTRLRYGTAKIMEIVDVTDQGILLSLSFDGLEDWAFWHNCWLPDEYLEDVKR